MSELQKAQKRCFIVCPNPSIDILASIDSIESAASNRIKSEKRFPGGKGIHVAMALAEMQVPTTLIGFWGKENGKWLKESCQKYQANLEVIGPDVPGWNRSCYTFQSSPEWQDTEILGTGPVMNATHFEMLCDKLKERKDEIHSIAIAGSWPVGAVSDYNQKLVELGHSLKIPTFLDCTGAQLKNALTALPYFVHLNKSEVCTYFDEDFSTSKSKISKLCRVAAVTDGAKGLYLSAEGKEIHAAVKISEVKSTVGAGDCLTAGVIYGHYKNMSYEDMAKKGAACGAANCVNEDLGMLRKEDVDELFKRTKSQVMF